MLPTPLQYIGGGFLGYFLAIHPSPVSLEGGQNGPGQRGPLAGSEGLLQALRGLGEP